MKFKDIKVGMTMHRLNKKCMEYSTTQVANVSAPYYTNNGQVQRVVDVTMDGKTYVVPEDSCVTYNGDMIFSPNKDTIVLEVQAIRGNAETIVNKYEDSRATMSKCDKVLEELDESLAEKKRVDLRFASIEHKLEELLNKLS